MPKPKRPSLGVREMLLERDIALWDAYHFQTPQSTGKTANSKDPISVTLMTPHAVDRIFYGRGPDIDSAVLHGLASNSGLNFHEAGITGALARLENALHHLSAGLYTKRCERAMDRYKHRERMTADQWQQWSDDLDDDIPF